MSSSFDGKLAIVVDLLQIDQPAIDDTRLERVDVGIVLHELRDRFRKNDRIVLRPCDRRHAFEMFGRLFKLRSFDGDPGERILYNLIFRSRLTQIVAKFLSLVTVSFEKLTTIADFAFCSDSVRAFRSFCFVSLDFHFSILASLTYTYASSSSNTPGLIVAARLIFFR